MARTFGGLLFYDASQINFVSTGTTTYTRNAKGDVSVNQSASVTAQYQFGLADVKRPFINFPMGIGQGTVLNTNELQEVFGSTPGVAGGPGPGNPFNGGQTGNQFGTPTTPWGIALIDIFALYSVTGGALTSATLGASRQVYSNNAAFTITDVVAPTATPTAASNGAAQPYVAKISLAQPLSFESTDLSDILVELVLVTPVAVTARVYGLGAHVAVEYS